MPDLLYFIWALLPLSLLWITVKAGSKAALKKGKREYPKSYFNELVFSVVAFAVSIWLDKVLCSQNSSFRMTIEGFGLDHRLVRWLIFPAIITGASVVQQIFIDKERREAEAEKTARRLRYAPK